MQPGPPFFAEVRVVVGRRVDDPACEGLSAPGAGVDGYEGSSTRSCAGAGRVSDRGGPCCRHPACACELPTLPSKQHRGSRSLSVGRGSRECLRRVGPPANHSSTARTTHPGAGRPSGWDRVTSARSDLLRRTRRRLRESERRWPPCAAGSLACKVGHCSGHSSRPTKLLFSRTPCRPSKGRGPSRHLPAGVGEVGESRRRASGLSEPPVRLPGAL